MALWDHQQTTALGDQIVVGEDHGGALVTVVENLRFHAVEAKADGDLHRLCGGLKNVLQMFLDLTMHSASYYASLTLLPLYHVLHILLKRP